MCVYAVLTERFCRRAWRRAVELLLAGGADVIQLREKEMGARELLQRARILRELTAEAGALLIINDRPDVAILSQADGVHVGQGDLGPAEIRKLAGPDILIGLSTESLAQARDAVTQPVDYIGVGPAYPTSTKQVRFGRGTELIRQVCGAVDLPTVAIGGITPDNAPEAIEAGATAVAAISSLCGADDPRAAARAMRTAVEKARARRRRRGDSPGRGP